MFDFLQQLNLVAECRALRWKLRQCPPFLFLLMGLTIVCSMIATYSLANRFTNEPEIAALIVIFVTVVLLVLGNSVITGFNRVATANRMKTEFITIVSHQLRSPLSIFKWTLDAWEREPNSERHVLTLRDTTERMISLVNSLLEVSRIESQTFVLKKERLNLTEFTERILKNFARYAESYNVDLELNPRPGIPELWGDPERLEMVIQNLVDNAIRYTVGGGKVTVEIVPQDSKFIRWSIQDQGVGIPAVDQKSIFQKFFRSDKIQTTQTRGTGIGLYIAKNIIEALGGKIDFESQEGKGSTFWFTLPIK